ncbi:unnamed protein product [Closterium sp. NIES-54]
MNLSPHPLRGGSLLLLLSLLSALLLPALIPAAHASLRSQGLLPGPSALPAGTTATTTAAVGSAGTSAVGGSAALQRAVAQPMGLIGRLRKWWKKIRGKKPPSAAPTGACQKSSLSGFTSSVDLSGTGLILHWNVVAAGGTQLDMALEAKGATLAGGWFSVGWSPDGSMVGSDAVIAIPGGTPEYDAYVMTAQTVAGVATTTTFTLGSAPSFTATPGTNAVLTFSRSTGDGGAVPVNVAGSNYMVWAYSADGTTTLDNHGGDNRGSRSIDFTCDGTKVASMCPASTLTGFDYQTNLGGNKSRTTLTTPTPTPSLYTTPPPSPPNPLLTLSKNHTRYHHTPRLRPPSLDSPSPPLLHCLSLSPKDVSKPGVNPGSFSISTAAATTTSPSGSTLVTFTRTQGSGRINVNGVNNILWAYSGSQSQALTTHGGNKGSLLVDLSCRTKPKCVKRKILWWKCKRNGGGDDDDGGDGGHDEHH